MLKKWRFKDLAYYYLFEILQQTLLVSTLTAGTLIHYKLPAILLTTMTCLGIVLILLMLTFRLNVIILLVPASFFLTLIKATNKRNEPDTAERIDGYYLETNFNRSSPTTESGTLFLERPVRAEILHCCAQFLTASTSYSIQWYGFTYLIYYKFECWKAYNHCNYFYSFASAGYHVLSDRCPWKGKFIMRRWLAHEKFHNIPYRRVLRLQALHLQNSVVKKLLASYLLPPKHRIIQFKKPLLKANSVYTHTKTRYAIMIK